MREHNYTHKTIKINLIVFYLRFSFYKLNEKLTIRFEISKGWDN